MKPLSNSCLAAIVSFSLVMFAAGCGDSSGARANSGKLDKNGETTCTGCIVMTTPLGIPIMNGDMLIDPTVPLQLFDDTKYVLVVSSNKGFELHTSERTKFIGFIDVTNQPGMSTSSTSNTTTYKQLTLGTAAEYKAVGVVTSNYIDLSRLEYLSSTNTGR